MTAVGGTGYAYDSNGNMTTRGSLSISWDVENRPVAMSDNSTFVYDGNGNRGMKTEGGETILYINRYYEKNLTTEEVTTHYYLGDRQVAQRKGTALNYLHQDHLTGTAMMTDSSGDSTGTIKYFPFGATRSGSVSTDKQFTGQRLDCSGLYYYGARYYDAEIGRFISADTVVPDPLNPQSLNRYSYCLNNPLKYNDPSGHESQYDYMNAYYEANCAAAGIDPSAGYILAYGDGGWQSIGVTVGDFVGWVDSTSEPWDYISQSPAQVIQGIGLSQFGVKHVYSYHMNLTAEPIPTYIVGDQGIIPTLLTISGISLYPLGTYIRQSYYEDHPEILAHEGKHYSEQRDSGMIPWLTVYCSELLDDWYYSGVWCGVWSFWEGPYNINSAEMRARAWAGEPLFPWAIPVPWSIPPGYTW